MQLSVTTRPLGLTELSKRNTARQPLWTATGTPTSPPRPRDTEGVLPCVLASGVITHSHTSVQRAAAVRPAANTQSRLCGKVMAWRTSVCDVRVALYCGCDTITSP